MNMGKSVVRLGLLLALVVVLSGCSFFGSIEWEWKGPKNDVSGKVTLRDLGVPLMDARVFFNGPIDRSVVTRRSGAYSITLPDGTYDVTVRTLHDDYKTRVTVRDSEVINLSFWAGSWFDQHEFYGLSGIRRYYFQGDRLNYDDAGELARWEKSRVRIYFDTHSAPTWRADDWAEEYFKHIRDTWRSLLKDSIAFERVYSPGSADVEVQWVRAGTLVDGEGYRVVARSAFYWEDGSLKKVRIQIDEDWAMEPGIWEHEWAHAMGIGYTDDPYSLMYPELWARPNQRTAFSSSEARHIQLIYNLPSGLTKAQVWSMAAEETGDQGDGEGEAEVPALQESAGYGYAGHMRRVDGRVIPMEEAEAADTVLGW